MTVAVTYIGPYPDVFIEIDKAWVEVQSGETVEVPDDYAPGLLAQPDNWAEAGNAKKAPAKKAASTPRKKAAKAPGKPTGDSPEEDADASDQPPAQADNSPEEG